MKYLFTTFVLSIGLIIPIPLHAQTSDHVQWSDIHLATQSGDYLAAIDLLHRLEIEKVDSLQYRKSLAQSYYRLGDYFHAKENAMVALGMDAKEKAMLNLLGAIFDLEFNLPKSIKYYTRLLETDTLNPYYYKQNARIQLKAGFKPQAFQYFARAYKLNPKDVMVVTELTNLLLESDQYQQVDSILNIASIQDSTNIQIILAQARSKYQQKDYATVTSHIEQTFGRIDLPEYYIKMLGYSYLQIDSVDQAIYWLERLLHADQKEFVHYYLAIAYEQKGDLKASLYHYDLAIQKSISQSIDRYYAEAAQLFEEEGELRKAIKYYQEAIHFEQKPQYLYALALLADRYYKDKSIALRYFDQYIKTQDDHAAFMDYARKKARYLKEQIHSSNQTLN